MIDFKSCLEALKLSPRHVAVIMIVAGVILWTPREFAERLGIAEFTDNHRMWVGLVFLISSAILFVALIVWISKTISKKKRRKLVRKSIIESLETLTEQEKQILRFYILHQTKSNSLRIDDGVVSGLVSKKIIFRSASVGSTIAGFSHNISEIAWEHLNKNEGLLNGSTTVARTDNVRF